MTMPNILFKMTPEASFNGVYKEKWRISGGSGPGGPGAAQARIRTRPWPPRSQVQVAAALVQSGDAEPEKISVRRFLAGKWISCRPAVASTLSNSVCCNSARRVLRALTILYEGIQSLFLHMLTLRENILSQYSHIWILSQTIFFCKYKREFSVIRCAHFNVADILLCGVGLQIPLASVIPSHITLWESIGENDYA